MDHPFLSIDPRSLREKIRAIFSMPLMGIAVSTLDKNFFDVNEGFCSMVGYSPDELRGMTWVDLTHPDDLAADVEQFQRVISGEQDNYVLEKRYIRKDGQTVWAEVAVQAFRLDDGRIDFFIAFTYDVTRRMDIRSALQEQLDVTRKLVDRLEFQNRLLHDFAHITSHNLRSPIGNLRGLIELFKRESDESERDFLFTQIDTVCNSLMETISILTNTLQIREGIDMQRERVRFDDVLQRVQKNIVADLRDANATVDADFSDCPTIRYPETYVESIIMNLLTNAVKYRSPNRQPNIVIRTLRDDDGAVMTFSDNGLGINMQRHGHKLFGLNKTFHRHPDARGIGLFLTRSMVEAMGGTITASSEEDIGTTFTIRFEHHDSV